MTGAQSRSRQVSPEYTEGYVDSLESIISDLEHSVSLEEAKQKLFFRKRIVDLITRAANGGLTQ